MRTTRVAVAAIVVGALVAGVVAAPAAASTTGDAVASDAEAGSAGPPVDLPGPVPDVVEGIVESIRGFVGDLTPAGIVG